MQKSQSLTDEESHILVVIATLGQRSEMLKQTLDSIVSQEIEKLDIVLVYPLKNKETAALAKAYGAKSIDDPGSMSAAVNVGILSATKNHQFVTWIGDDDLLTSGSLKSSLALLSKDPAAVATFGYCDYIDTSGRHIFTSKAGAIAPWLMTWGPDLVPLPGAVFRLSALKGLDYIFDEKLRYAMDLDLFLRLRKKGKLVNVGKTVSSFRWHPSSATVSNRELSLREAEAVKRRYLSSFGRALAPLWEWAVRLLTKLAARRVNALAIKQPASSDSTS